MKETMSPRVAEAEQEVKSTVAAAVGNEHLDCVMRHLEPKLDYMWSNWWTILMDTGRDLLWPWPGVAEDFTTIWAHIKSMGSNLWDLEFSAATDDLLAIARLLAAAGGRLWGGFALAAIIIGGIWGGVFGHSSEARRLGNECVSKCRFRWSPSHKNKK